MSLLDRHLRFVEALRTAGLPVSLSEDLDAVAALGKVGWSSRSQVRDVYAATLLKREAYRPTFEALFELYFPRQVGDGLDAGASPGQDGPEDLADFRDRLAAAMGPELDAVDPGPAGDVDPGAVEAREGARDDALRRLAAEAMNRFGAMPGRGPGLSSWSSYTALRRVDVEEVRARLVQGLLDHGWSRQEAERTAARRATGFTELVEADARRRIVEEKGPEQMARVAVRGAVDQLDFLNLRRAELDQLRREVYPLARRLAARLAREQHSRRRGPLDMRRTMRASIGTGGVPITTYRKPKRRHRPELVVLCDVSGSVSNFASFTLLLVNALAEAFSKVRAFTFVDTVVEVTDEFGPDIADTMARLVERASFSARYGRTNYGRAFADFFQTYADALTPKTTLLILGDGRSNYANVQLGLLREMVHRTRHAWWLNPEVRRQWDTGDSEASRFGQVVEMVECRNLAQLTEFVQQLA